MAHAHFGPKNLIQNFKASFYPQNAKKTVFSIMEMYKVWMETVLILF